MIDTSRSVIDISVNFHFIKTFSSLHSAASSTYSRADVSRVMVTVSPLDQELRDNFTVRLATNHYSFTLGRSVTIRAFTAFLYLEVRQDIDP